MTTAHHGPVPERVLESLEGRRTPIEDLADFDGNPQTHDLAAIEEALREFGQVSPLLANRGTLTGRGPELLSGHGRITIMRRDGWERPAVDWGDWTDTECRKLLLALNGTTAHGHADVDPELLARFVVPLDGDLLGSTWTLDGIQELLAARDAELAEELEKPPGGDPDEQEPAPPPTDPVTRAGDVWTLGRHRLMCGSATSAEDVARLVDGAPIDMVHTDPPYGISVVRADGRLRGHGGKGNWDNSGTIASSSTAFSSDRKSARAGKIGGDNKDGGTTSKMAGASAAIIKNTVYEPVIGDDTTDTARDAVRLVDDYHPNTLQVWWGANYYADTAGLGDTRCWLVWDKQNDGNDFADAELAWTNDHRSVRLFRHMWSGMLRASERGKRVHPNQKPVALARWVFERLDPKAERQHILDLFGGSGFVLLACEMEGRNAYVMEMSPAYVDLIIGRWQLLTGQVPTLNGEPVDVLAGKKATTPA